MALYKVLLADDEEEIRNGIIRKIDWEKYGFVLSGSAENGQEAWEIAEKIRPDLVLTDIKMPFMNGLELGEKISIVMPFTKLVLFSGFDDFEYAKQAIKINATEYILKPIDSKEIIALLKKLKIQLDKEMDERRNAETLRQNYIQSLPILRQQFYTSLIEGKFGEERIEELANQYQISFKGNCYSIAVMRSDVVENGGLGSLSGQAELVPISLRQMVGETLARVYETKSFIYNDDLIIIGMFNDEKDILGFLDALNRVCHMAKEVLELSVTAGVGTVCHKCSKLKFSYEGALSAVEYRILMGDRAIYIEDVEPDFSKELEFDEETQRLLINAIKIEGKQAIRNVVDGMISRLQEGRLPLNQYHIYLTELLSELFKIVRAYKIDRDEVFGADFKGYFHIQDYESFEELGQWIFDVCEKISMMIKKERMNSAKLLAEKAKDFVALNYHDTDVSVEMLCSYLHVSPAYFSTIFKKETGISFITHLTNVRMEEAVNLLNSTDDKTYVISFKVGYTEPNYFSYVFKKHFGVSPSKYRCKISK